MSQSIKWQISSKISMYVKGKHVSAELLKNHITLDLKWGSWSNFILLHLYIHSLWVKYYYAYLNYSVRLVSRDTAPVTIIEKKQKVGVHATNSTPYLCLPW